MSWYLYIDGCIGVYVCTLTDMGAGNKGREGGTA